MMDERRIHIVARADDIPPGAHQVVQIHKRNIGIFNVAGQYYALPSLCPHQLGPLCRGRVSGTIASRRVNNWKREWIMEGEIVTCPWHGMEYHILTGQCLAHPEIRLRSYRVWVEDSLIKIQL
jgi:nitrite reductase (NADH) small subunit